LKHGAHFVGLFLKLLERLFDDFAGANRPLGFRGKGVEGQPGDAITLQRFDGRRIDHGRLFIEGGSGLVGLHAIRRIENGPECRFDAVVLSLGDISQDIRQFVFDAAQAGRRGKFRGQGIQHRLIAISGPQADVLQLVPSANSHAATCKSRLD
jgi:hypothetical protein